VDPRLVPGGSFALKQYRVPKLKIEYLWPLIAIAGIFIIVATHPIRPHDFWWHLRAGEEIFLTRSIPTIDTYSYTMAGGPYDNYAAYWLVEIAYYLVYQLGQLPVIIILHALVVTAAYALLLFLARRASGSWRIGTLAVLFAAALGIDNWNVRPQAAGYLFFALCLWAILSYREHAWPWLLAIPPLAILLWVNSHGSFVLGFILLVIWIADALWAAVWPVLHTRGREEPFVRLGLRQVRTPLGILAISLVTSLLNPRGAGIFGYVGAISANPAIRSLVTEWDPPTLNSFTGILFVGMFLLMAIVFAVSPRRPSAFAFLSYTVFGLIAFSASRSVVWFGLVLVPPLAEHLTALSASFASHRELGSITVRSPGAAATSLNYMIAFFVLVGVIASLPWFKHLLPLSGRKAGLVSLETPVAAVNVLLDRRLPRELFNEMGFGSYLIWAAPDYPVYIDTRVELYPTSQWMEYQRLSAAESGWEGRLEARGVRTLLLNPEAQPALVQAARASRLWQVVWEDASAVLLMRREVP